MSEYELFDTESGNAVVVALDHGISKGAVEGFERPRETLHSVLEGEPDALITRPPFAERYDDIISERDVDVILTGDVLSFSTTPAKREPSDIWTGAFSLDLLKELNPAGVKVVLIFGRDDRETYQRNVEHIVDLYEGLRGTGIPLIVEPVMWGPRIPDELSVDPGYVTHASRIGWELGSDILKVPYTGDPDQFEELVDQSPVPVTILGGPANGVEPMLSEVSDAIEAGARGVMIGRSIWQTDSPAQMVRHMKDIVHGGKRIDDLEIE